jgi:hypothetical protein
MIIPRSRSRCVWLTLDIVTRDVKEVSLPIQAKDRTLHDINKDRSLGIKRVAMLANRRLGAMIMNCSMRSPLITEEPLTLTLHTQVGWSVPMLALVTVSGNRVDAC